MRPLRTLTAATMLAAVALTGCGGGKDDTGTRSLASVASQLSTVQATAPKCADLFASGVTLPAVMPELCVRDRGDLLAVTAVVCADRRKLYEMTDTFDAWAFAGGTVTTSQDMAADPAFKAAYNACG